MPWMWCPCQSCVARPRAQLSRVNTLRSLLVVAALSLAAVAWMPQPHVPPSAVLPDSLAAWMRRGVSLGLAEQRARTIRDVRYDLALDVSALDRATGRVTSRGDAPVAALRLPRPCRRRSERR